MLSDTDDYKQLVMEILWDGKHINRFVCELRITLFINALNVSDKLPECLMPFPFHFYDPVTKTKDIKLLREHVESIPPLDTIKDTIEFPILTWKLLHWILTNPLTISALHLTEQREVFVQRLVEETKLVDIPRNSIEYMIYFKIDTQTPKKRFEEGKKTFGTFFAYHGSKLENFHSIIHRGLIGALNRRSVHGFGTYLTLHFKTAIGHSTPSIKWRHSRILSSRKGVRCVGIVEIVDHPSVKWKGSASFNALPMETATDEDPLWTQRKSCYCCVVDRDELMQLRYLIVTS